VESADSRPRLPSRWAGVGPKLPPALENLTGPSGAAWWSYRSTCPRDLAGALPRADLHGASSYIHSDRATRTELAAAGRAALDEDFSLETLRDQLTVASTYPDEHSPVTVPGQLIAEVKAWALSWSTEIGLDLAESES